MHLKEVWHNGELLSIRFVNGDDRQGHDQFSFCINGNWYVTPLSRRNRFWYPFMDFPGWVFSGIMP
jgi:hypothetical protein